MSEYGPAIFISRKDKQPIEESEQEDVRAAVAEACKALKFVDPMEETPVEVSKYDYDGYETNALGLLLWSNYAFGQAPEFVQEDMQTDAARDGKKIGAKLQEKFPGVYSQVCYVVEV